VELHTGINFINMFMNGFFVRKTKKLPVFENEFYRAFLYKNCVGCAIHKPHLAILVTICKLQLAVRKKASKKARCKHVDEIDPRSPLLK
jgi:hypothetical protein